MTDYTKSTNFATKDSLPPGSALKIVRGTEIDTEFNAIATAVATKADSSSVTTSLALKADLASPALTGTPTAPTPTAGDNDTSIATTAFVSTAVSTAVATAVNNVGYPAFKNRIINGAMVIDQRNAGASVTPTNGQYTVDRFQTVLTQASKFTVQQNAGSVTPPAGFTKYLGCTSSSAYSVAAGDLFTVGQAVEGLNVSDLGWGTANAQTVTLSFWVRSSLTGTFAGSVQNQLQTYSYVFTYTISAANTWEYKTVTISGQTAGTWATDNTNFAYVRFSLGVGSTYQTATTNAWVSGNYWSTSSATSVVGTSGATFYITGVQIEKGSTATSFDYRPYGTELALCQRYFYQATAVSIAVYNTASYTYGSPVRMPVTMRSTPTLASGATFVVGSGSAGTVTIASGLGLNASPDAVTLYNSAANWSTNANIAVTAGFSAEL